MPLKHAKHNQAVCLFLKSNTDYNDWIITTAYYSAIYFIYHALFPDKYEDPISGDIKSFNSWEKYCHRLPVNNNNKHKATENLVSEHFPEIYREFKILKDNCWTARYDKYIVVDSIMEECVKGLSTIAEFCENHKMN